MRVFCEHVSEFEVMFPVRVHGARGLGMDFCVGDSHAIRELFEYFISNQATKSLNQQQT